MVITTILLGLLALKMHSYFIVLSGGGILATHWYLEAKDRSSAWLWWNVGSLFLAVSGIMSEDVALKWIGLATLIFFDLVAIVGVFGGSREETARAHGYYSLPPDLLSPRREAPTRSTVSSKHRSGSVYYSCPPPEIAGLMEASEYNRPPSVATSDGEREENEAAASSEAPAGRQSNRRRRRNRRPRRRKSDSMPWNPF